MIEIGMLSGAGIALGLLLIVRGLLAPPRPLALALRELDPVPPATSAAVVEHLGGRRARIARRLSRALTDAGVDLAKLDTDLAVVGRTREQHLVEKVTASAAGLLLPVAFAVLTGLGGVAVPPVLWVLATAGLALGGFLLPDIALRSQATERRRSFRFALSSYLDLVNVILAAGAGTETALLDAADAGDSWAFGLLRSAMARARLTGESPWEAFERVGHELDLPELREAASGLALAGTQGARVRSSLAARAEALRARDLADMEAQAESATERMSVPSVVLVVGFIMFVGYPAAHTILGS